MCNLVLCLVYVVLGWTVLQFCIVFINAMFSQKMRQQKIRENPLVSILIPARNEEDTIAGLLDDCLQQSYPHIQILVYDDESTDATAAIIADYAAVNKSLTVVPGSKLPTGWLGKNNACYQLGQRAQGDYLLFLDADVRISPVFVEKILSHCVVKQRDLITVFPRQKMCSAGEWSTVPLMNYILLSLLPLVLVRFPFFTSLSAANGQCMFYKADTYQKIQPHVQVCNKKVEDIAIARLYKSLRKKISCHASEADIYCRMYTSFNEAVQGFSKNMVSFFGSSYILASLFWLVQVGGFVLVLLYLPLFLVLGYVFVRVCIRILIAYTSNQHIGKSVLFSFFQICVMIYIIVLSIQYSITKRYIWKGRNISY